MKNFLKLNGVKLLSKQEQKDINGAYNPVYCSQDGRKCCTRFGTVEICDYGYCLGHGRCIWA